MTASALVHHHSDWISETRPHILFENFDHLLRHCQFHVLNYVEHHFMPQGYTCLWLLAESHLAIHTFPEQEKSYIELTSCNLSKQEAFVQGLNQLKLNNQAVQC